MNFALMVSVTCWMWTTNHWVGPPASFISCNSPRDKVKLGIAYLVECLLLGNIDKKLINIDTLRLVTDVESFNKVAWGKKGFECLLPYLVEFRELSPDKQASQLGEFYIVL